MLKNNFGYSGSDPAANEFVETVNAIATLLNNIQFDFGENGGTEVAKVDTSGGRLLVDLRALYIPPKPEVV